MRKAQAKEKMMFAVGAIVICLLGIVFVVLRITPGLESSRQGQAIEIANMIANSVNTLSSADAGYLRKDFGLSQPLTVEVYAKGGKSILKVTYDDKGGIYEVPLLVSIDPVPPAKVNWIEVAADRDGKVYMTGQIVPKDYTSQGDRACKQPSPQEINGYIDLAVSGQPAVDKNLIKAVMTQESTGGCQCKGCTDGYYLESGKGAIGMMQVLPGTAMSMGANPKAVNNPQQNVMLGTKYLADQIKAFGSVELGLVAYNAGAGWLLEKAKCQKPENCHECMKICGLTSKSSRYDIQNCACLSGQTREYVPKVLDFRDYCYAQKTAQCTLKECRLC